MNKLALMVRLESLTFIQSADKQQRWSLCATRCESKKCADKKIILALPICVSRMQVNFRMSEKVIVMWNNELKMDSVWRYSIKNVDLF